MAALLGLLQLLVALIRVVLRRSGPLGVVGLGLIVVGFLVMLVRPPRLLEWPATTTPTRGPTRRR